MNKYRMEKLFVDSNFNCILILQIEDKKLSVLNACVTIYILVEEV